MRSSRDGILAEGASFLAALRVPADGIVRIKVATLAEAIGRSTRSANRLLDSMLDAGWLTRAGHGSFRICQDALNRSMADFCHGLSHENRSMAGSMAESPGAVSHSAPERDAETRCPAIDSSNDRNPLGSEPAPDTSAPPPTPPPVLLPQKPFLSVSGEGVQGEGNPPDPDPDPERLERPEEEPDQQAIRRGSALLAGLLGLEALSAAEELIRAGWDPSSLGALVAMANAKKKPRTWLDSALARDPTLALYLSHCRRPAAGAHGLATGGHVAGRQDAPGPGFSGQGGEISPPPGRDAMLDEITARRARRAAEDEAAKRVQLRHREVVLPILGELRVLEDESLERLVDSFSARSNYRMVARALRRYREGDGEALDFGLAGAPWDLVSRYAVFMGLLLEEDLPR